MKLWQSFAYIVFHVFLASCGVVFLWGLNQPGDRYLERIMIVAIFHSVMMKYWRGEQ